MSMTPCVVCGEEVETDHCTINVCKSCCRANRCPCHSMCEARHLDKRIYNRNGWKSELILDCIGMDEEVDKYELMMRGWAKHRSHLTTNEIASVIHHHLMGVKLDGEYRGKKQYRRKVYWRIK